ncbi:FAD:protein FMN transferase [Streptomyces sp. NPDC006251]|uniref:FAD:protein FMN transferase n=1 Tax=Streptomyces sp. NPDC006251 TaxID=3155718 RepID=UPI0033B27DBD
MGSVGHLIVVAGAAGLLERAQKLLAELEACWSRFRPDSELSLLNASPGQWVKLSVPTVALIGRAVQAWGATGGLYDPTVLPALEAAGYDRSFETLDPEDGTQPAAAAAPGCAGIEIDHDRVRLPAGVRLDLGGIGKGYAADLVAAELLDWGAEGACVNLGGDVRVAGRAPAPDGWTVAVDDHLHPEQDLSWVALADGAVASSTRLRRRWQRGGRELHHLIDPRTGRPAESSVAAVTVVAAQAHWAEILAKAALIAGLRAGSELLCSHGVAGVLVTGDGTVHRAGPWERYESWTPHSGGTSPASAD